MSRTKNPLNINNPSYVIGLITMYVKILENGCPICGGDVKGNFKFRYLCINCNILFRYKDLKKPTKIKETITDNPKIKDKL